MPATPQFPSKRPGALARDGKEPHELYTHPLSRPTGQLSHAPAKQERAAALAFDSSHPPYGRSALSPCHVWQEILWALSLLRQGPPSGSDGRPTLSQAFQYRNLTGPTPQRAPRDKLIAHPAPCGVVATVMTINNPSMPDEAMGVVEHPSLEHNASLDWG